MNRRTFLRALGASVAASALPQPAPAPSYCAEQRPMRVNHISLETLPPFGTMICRVGGVLCFYPSSVFYRRGIDDV